MFNFFSRKRRALDVSNAQDVRMIVALAAYMTAADLANQALHNARNPKPPRRAMQRAQALPLAVIEERRDGLLLVDRYTGTGALQGMPYYIRAANVDILP